jgi:hypothetical protein
MSVPIASPSGERLVPASLNGQIVHVSCPDWCVVNHAADDPNHIEDIDHKSEQVSLSAPVGGHMESVLEAWLSAFPFSEGGEARLALDVTGGGNPAGLSAAEAVAFADQLVAHAAVIRSLAERMASR